MTAEIKVLRLTEPFRIAHGTSSERMVVRVHHEGAVGEAPFVPYYGDDPKETLTCLQGLTVDADGRVMSLPHGAPRPARLARSLLQMDLLGRKNHLPMSRCLGADSAGAGHRIPPGGRSVGIPVDLESFAEKIRATARQFRVLKLKLGSGNLDFDEAVAACAIQAAPDATIFADANGGWSVSDAAKIIPKLAAQGLAFIEQPFHHSLGIEGWRELRSALRGEKIPLFADESAQDATDVAALDGLVEGINVKLLKCGGVAEAIEAIHTARRLNMRVLLGCMIESSIGVTAAAHLAHLADWIDLDGHLYVANDDFTGVQSDESGNLLLPARPGIGVELRVG